MTIQYEECPYCKNADGTEIYKCNECGEVFCEVCYAKKSALEDPFNFGAKFCPNCKSDHQDIDYEFGVIN